jgi:hypothetical protein
MSEEDRHKVTVATSQIETLAIGQIIFDHLFDFDSTPVIGSWLIGCLHHELCQ